MAVDTFAKRMTIAGVPMSALGPNVFPGTTSNSLGRAAAAWNYFPVAFTPTTGGEGDTLITLGLESSSSVTVNPTLGGFLGH